MCRLYVGYRYIHKIILGIVAGIVLFCGMYVYAQDSIIITPDVKYAVYERSAHKGFEISYNAESVSSMEVKAIHYDGSEFDLGSYPVAKGYNVVKVNANSVDRLGHYRLQVSVDGLNNEAMFAVVKDYGERRDSAESAAALGTMMRTTLKDYEIDDYVNTVKLAGITHVRDFLRVEDLARFDEDGNYIGLVSYSKFDKYMEAYEKAGIDVLLMIQDWPNEMRRLVAAGTDKELLMQLPEDMTEVYQFFIDVVQKYGDTLDYIQILNEMDASGTDADSPDLYASILKTASLAVEASGKDVKVAQQAFGSSKGVLEVYKSRVAQNKTVDYFDAYAQHWYTADTLAGSIDVIDPEAWDCIDIADRYGNTKRPTFITELGYKTPYQYEDPTKIGNELTWNQAQRGARFLPTAFAKIAELGIERAYWFRHTYHLEKGQGYGTMSYNKEPYPIYSALAAYTDAVGNAKYVGQLENVSNNINSAYMEDIETGESVICLWSQENTEAEICLPVNNALTIDLMGNETEITGQDGVFYINIGPDMTYIRFSGQLDEASYKKAISKYNYEERPEPEDHQKVVLRTAYSDDAVRSRSPRVEGYGLKKSGETITLHLYNFNEDRAVTGTVTAYSELEWELSTAENTKITIPAMGHTEIEYSISCNGDAKYLDESAILFEFHTEGNDAENAPLRSVSYVKLTDGLTRDINVPAANRWANHSWWTASGSGTTVNASGNYVAISNTYDGNSDSNFTSRAWVQLEDINFSGTDGIVFNYSANKSITDVMIHINIFDKIDGSDKFERHFGTFTLGRDIQKRNHVPITTEEQQAIIYWNDLEHINSSYDKIAVDDGVLTSGDIAGGYIDIVVTAAAKNEVETGETITYTLSDFGAFRETERLNITATDVAYIPDTTTLRAAVSNAENAVFMVDKRLYDAVINGDYAELNIVLEPGEHEIKTFAYNKAGKAAMCKAVISVLPYDEKIVLSYDANHGNNEPEAEFVEAENSVISNMLPDREGYAFAGWSTDRATRVPDLVAGDKFVPSADTVLYAIWHKKDSDDVVYSEGAFYAEGTNRIVIKGHISKDAEKREIRKGTVLVINGSDFENISPDNLLYVGMVNVDYSGNYKIEFTIPSDKACEDINVLFNIDGIIEEMPVTSSTISYDWIDFKTDVLYASHKGKILVRSRTNNIATEGMPYVVLIAYYNTDDVLISAEVHNNVSENGYNDIFVKSDKVEDAVYARIFTWNSVNEMNPVAGNEIEGQLGISGDQK